MFRLAIFSSQFWVQLSPKVKQYRLDKTKTFIHNYLSISTNPNNLFSQNNILRILTKRHKIISLFYFIDFHTHNTHTHTHTHTLTQMHKQNKSKGRRRRRKRNFMNFSSNFQNVNAKLVVKLSNGEFSLLKSDITARPSTY